MQIQHAFVLLASLLALAGSPPPSSSTPAAPGPGPGPQQEPIEPVLVPPNVVVLLVDDLGLDQLMMYEDVNQYSCPYPYAYTPNLDYLASIGVRFRQARVMPLCSPTRAAMQSGRYGRRTGCGHLVSLANRSTSFCELNLSSAIPYTLLGDALDPFGYESGMFGKLHLQIDSCDACLGAFGNGTGDSYANDVLGFDRFEGVLRNLNTNPTPGPHSCDPNNEWRDHPFTYYYHVSATTGLSPFRELQCGCPGGCPATTNQCTQLACSGDCTSGCAWQDCYNGTYATRKQRLELENWMQGTSGPFFALWCLNDIHGPNEWPPAFDPTNPTVEGHFHGSTPPPDDHDNRRLRAKLEYVDSSLGLLLQSIDLETTVVMVMGDNGTQAGGAQNVKQTEVAYPPGHPLYPFSPWPCPVPVGGPVYTMAPYDPAHLKSSPYEGGIRVPLIVAGAGVVPGSGSPRVSDALVDAVDVYETLREIAEGASYVPPQTCVNGGGTGCTDSVSFACVLKNTCTAGTHARQYSHAGLFQPNSFPPAPYATLPPGAKAPSEAYIRRGSTGRLWKIVRHYVAGGCYTDEFYEVVTDPLETNDLGTSHSQYAATKAEFNARFATFNGCP